MIAEEFIEANQKYAANFTPPKLNRRNIAVVTCMDPRVQPYEQLGLKIGEGGIIRNASGSAEEAIHSLVVIQHVFKVTQIAVVHHTDCGATKFTTEWLRDKVKAANPGRDDVVKTIDGMDWHNFTDVEESVKRDLKYLAENPLVVKGTKVTGWIYDVDTGKISQVGDVVV
ncbi:carbonic anhydrase [Mycena albidolilacea]|uniref:Carbonic anhydrase n=1 Tax=Mycena albidolilacea TaxID=1033008 RepID=A0AAD7AEW7_9AGAR|nr:carbonic anhydrase [Mycena albidolilacea]